jgi:CHAD domain-containing protein
MGENYARVNQSGFPHSAWTEGTSGGHTRGMDRLHVSSKSLLQYKNNQIQNFENVFKKASQHPTPKRIHKIRIAIRRLSVVVNSRKLKDLAKVLGKERDLDVAIVNAKKYDLGTKRLIEDKKKISKKSLREMKNFNPKLLHHAPDAKILITYKILMRKLNLQLEHFQTMEMTDKKIHQLRITIKEVRYGLEAIGLPYVRLQRMQDLLGHIHDLEVLQKLKKKHKRIQKDKKLATEEFRRSYKSLINFMQKIIARI